MKRKYLHLNGVLTCFTLLSIFLFSAAFTNVLEAQSSISASSSEVITTDAYSDANTKWIAYPDFVAVVSSERTNAAAVLSGGNLSNEETALYTAYDKMLGYMQADLVVKAPIEKIAENNFNKTKAEFATDPALTDLQEAAFVSLYSHLLIKLIIN